MDDLGSTCAVCGKFCVTIVEGACAHCYLNAKNGKIVDQSGEEVVIPEKQTSETWRDRPPLL